MKRKYKKYENKAQNRIRLMCLCVEACCYIRLHLHLLVHDLVEKKENYMRICLVLFIFRLTAELAQLRINSGFSVSG